MIKKIIACLTICFIITGIISPVFSDASALPQPNWSDPGISEIINISDLTGWMLNGGTFDVSQYTDAENFMNDYFNARTKTRLVSPGEVAEDYYEVLPGFGINNQLLAGETFARPLDTNRVIASSFRDHSGYGRRLSNEVNEALLSSGSLYDTKIPLLSEVEFANFVGYNHDALRLYSEFFDNEPDVPTPDPDPDYIGSIALINSDSGSGLDFFFSDWGIENRGLPSFGSPTKYSWVVNASSLSNSNNLVTNSNYTQEMFMSNGILSANIIGSDSTWIINLSGSAIPSQPDGFGYCLFRCTATNIVRIYPGQSSSYYLGGQAYFNVSNKYLTSLNDCFNFLKAYRNINIYVNNEPWALVEEPVIPTTITPEFPDAVGGEDLESTTWPISRPRAPYYTNVPGVLQAIEDAIADDGKLDIDDLKPYLTDENGDPVPDPIFDPEPVPIPVPDPINPDVVPGLPILPAIPPEMPGFNGVSVLAEIINFTNQSLPSALIVTFWGIVFGIVILGLIKILHK